MSNIPVPGKQYTDRDGITVTVTDVNKSGGGNNYGMRRKGRPTGYSVTISNGKFECSIGLRAFELRGFKCTSP